MKIRCQISIVHNHSYLKKSAKPKYSIVNSLLCFPWARPVLQRKHFKQFLYGGVGTDSQRTSVICSHFYRSEPTSIRLVSRLRTVETSRCNLGTISEKLKMICCSNWRLFSDREILGACATSNLQTEAAINSAVRKRFAREITVKRGC